MSQLEMLREEAAEGGFASPGKSPAALRTISEVAEALDIPQHVLRFWESRFEQIQPLKRAGGRRFYRPEDVVLLRRIKELLYTQGYTIKGADKALRHPAAGNPQASLEKLTALREKVTTRKEVSAPPSEASADRRREELEALLAELKSLKELLAPAS